MTVERSSKFSEMAQLSIQIESMDTSRDKKINQGVLLKHIKLNVWNRTMHQKGMYPPWSMIALCQTSAPKTALFFKLDITTKLFRYNKEMVSSVHDVFINIAAVIRILMK